MGQALVKIKEGARVGVDHCYICKWPYVDIQKDEKGDIVARPVDAGLVFLGTKSKNSWRCVRPGFGQIPGDYGNGSLHLFDLDSVEYVTPLHKKGLLEVPGEIGNATNH